MEEEWLFVHSAAEVDLPNNTTLVMPMRRAVWAESPISGRQAYLRQENWMKVWDQFLKSDPPNALLTWVDGDTLGEVELVITGVSIEDTLITYTTTGTTGSLPNRGLQSNSLLETLCYNTSKITESFELICSKISPTFVLIVKPNCGDYSRGKYRC